MQPDLDIMQCSRFAKLDHVLNETRYTVIRIARIAYNLDMISGKKEHSLIRAGLLIRSDTVIVLRVCSSWKSLVITQVIGKMATKTNKRTVKYRQ